MSRNVPKIKRKKNVRSKPMTPCCTSKNFFWHAYCQGGARKPRPPLTTPGRVGAEGSEGAMNRPEQRKQIQRKLNITDSKGLRGFNKINYVLSDQGLDLLRNKKRKKILTENDEYKDVS